ncbi:MAG: hypothetical protein PVG63_04650 [Anaerolineales bacterium]|jgi:hypothetical protein
MTVRQLDWRDLPYLHRIRNQGLCLDSQQAYTHGANPLYHALFDNLTPSRITRTTVVRPDNGETPAVGQISYHAEVTLARLSFVGPIEALEKTSGLRLLEALSANAGECGAHALIAEVDEGHPAFEALRRAGFVVYARQVVWRLDDRSQLQPSPNQQCWREQRADDGPAVAALYINLVPALVQQVERPHIRFDSGMVYWSEGELRGYLDVESGSLGLWIRPYFHPAVETSQELLLDVLNHHLNHRQPVHVCVRSYQGGLTGALQAIGFEAFSQQAVMVKRLASSVRKPVFAGIPSLEGTQPEATTPLVGFKDSKGAGNGELQKSHSS